MFVIFFRDMIGRFDGRECDTLEHALEWSEAYRKIGYSHVTISSDNPNCTSKPGVDAVVDGKTPDGQSYEWRKRR